MGLFQSLRAGCSCRQFLVPTVAVVDRGLFLPGLRDQFLRLVAAVAAVAAVGRGLSPPERRDRYLRLERAVVAVVADRGSGLLERKDRYRLERRRRMGCWLRRVGHWQLIAEAGPEADAGGLSGSVA